MCFLFILCPYASIHVSHIPKMELLVKMCIFNFSRPWLSQKYNQNCCNNMHHRIWVHVSLCPSPTPDMISIFLTFANLTSKIWQLADVLVFAPLITREVEHLFSTYWSLLLLFFWDFIPPSVICFFLIDLCELFIMTITHAVLCAANIFFWSLALVLTLFIMSFTNQKWFESFVFVGWICQSIPWWCSEFVCCLVNSS